MRSYGLSKNGTSQAQCGVVLMSALIILLTLTLIALALIRLSVVELKVSGASQRYQILFNDAESMATLYFYSNQRNFVDGCLSADRTNYSTINPPRNASTQDICRFLGGATNGGATVVWDDARKMLTIPNILTNYSRVELVIEDMSCIDRYFSKSNSGQGADNTAPSAMFLDVQAKAWDQLDTDSSVTIHTGIVAQLPPGDACRQQ